MRRIPIAVFLTLVLTQTVPAAEDACQRFKWDVSQEVTLFRQAPQVLGASTTVVAAPLIDLGRLYALSLQPQESVQFRQPPTKRALDDGAYAGILKMRVPVSGDYRIAIDSGFWLDVSLDGKPFDALDFNGSAACAGPKKIVVYTLPAGAELVLQLSGAGSGQARLSVTPVATQPP